MFRSHFKYKYFKIKLFELFNLIIIGEHPSTQVVLIKVQPQERLRNHDRRKTSSKLNSEKKSMVVQLNFKIRFNWVSFKCYWVVYLQKAINELMFFSNRAFSFQSTITINKYWMQGAVEKDPKVGLLNFACSKLKRLINW